MYTYCHNEPIMYSDPTGHRSEVTEGYSGKYVPPVKPKTTPKPPVTQPKLTITPQKTLAVTSTLLPKITPIKPPAPTVNTGANTGKSSGGSSSGSITPPSYTPPVDNKKDSGDIGNNSNKNNNKKNKDKKKDKDKKNNTSSNQGAGNGGTSLVDKSKNWLNDTAPPIKANIPSAGELVSNTLSTFTSSALSNAAEIKKYQAWVVNERNTIQPNAAEQRVYRL